MNIACPLIYDTIPCNLHLYCQRALEQHCQDIVPSCIGKRGLQLPELILDMRKCKVTSH